MKKKFFQLKSISTNLVSKDFIYAKFIKILVKSNYVFESMSFEDPQYWEFSTSKM